MSAINPKRRECRAGPLSMRRHESDTMFSSLDTPALRRADAIVRNRRHVRNSDDLQTGRLQ